MKVLIIEDEQLAANLLQNMLRDIDPTIEVVAVLDSIEAALAFLKTPAEIDLALMDVELGDGQSFQIFHKAKKELSVIFITAYQEHALKAFKLHSIDYLLKPVVQDELVSALNKYRNWADTKRLNQSVNLNALINHLQLQRKETTTVKQRYLVKVGTRLISLELDQIAYFYVKERMQYVKTFDGKDYIIDKRIEEIELDVPPSNFFRVNRQFIINYKAIEKVNSWFSSKLKVQVAPLAFEDIIVGRLRTP
eukprot:gene57051-78169_t